jgi:hypothetical protein
MVTIEIVVALLALHELVQLRWPLELQRLPDIWRKGLDAAYVPRARAEHYCAQQKSRCKTIAGLFHSLEICASNRRMVAGACSPEQATLAKEGSLRTSRERTGSRLQNQDFAHSQIGPAALSNSLIWRRDLTPCATHGYEMIAVRQLLSALEKPRQDCRCQDLRV